MIENKMSNINHPKKEYIKLLVATIALSAGLSAAQMADDFNAYQYSADIFKPVHLKDLDGTTYSFTEQNTSPPKQITLGEYNYSIHGTITFTENPPKYEFTPVQNKPSSFGYWAGDKQKGNINISVLQLAPADEPIEPTLETENVTLQILTEQIAELSEDNASLKESIAYLSLKLHNQNKTIKQLKDDLTRDILRLTRHCRK